MMSYAAAAQRNGFLLAVVHIVNRDWGELVRVYQRLGFIPEGTDVKPIELALEDALPDVLSTDISELNFKVCLWCGYIGFSCMPLLFMNLHSIFAVYSALSRTLLESWETSCTLIRSHCRRFISVSFAVW